MPTSDVPEALRAYIEERVASGNFTDASDYVRALIREDRARQAKSVVEAQMLEGLASGPPVEANDAYWKALEAQVRASNGGSESGT
jgi:antitoxin ParD1/3/4